jgi:hypothetical protein
MVQHRAKILEHETVEDGQLKIQRTAMRGGWRVTLHGNADEKLDAATLVGGLKGVVVFDCDGLDRISSLGIRLWISAFNQLEASYYCFIRCRPVIVAQFNMVANFAGKGELISFYSPHICPKCGAQKQVLLDLRTHYAEVGRYEPPSVSCDKCGALCEFDEFPEGYFAHAAERTQPNPPALALELIDAGTIKKTESLKIEKDVTPELTVFALSGGLHNERVFKHAAAGAEGDVLVLLDRITSHSEPGIAALVRIGDMPGVKLFFARVPEPLLIDLSIRPGGCGAAKVLSLFVNFTCEDCAHTAPHAVDCVDFSDVVGFPVSCESCGGSMWAAADVHVLDALAKLGTALTGAAFLPLGSGESEAHWRRALLADRRKLDEDRHRPVEDG